MTAQAVPTPIDLIDLSVFAQGNPQRPLLLILPAVGPAEVADPDADLVPTALFGESSCEGADELRVAIRVQRDLVLRSLNFYGSAPREVIRVTSVFIGDEPVFTDTPGVPIERFERAVLGHVVDGWRVSAGLDVTVLARASAAASLAVNLLAAKRRSR